MLAPQLKAARQEVLDDLDVENQRRLIVLNKIDLLEHVPFDRESFWKHVANVNDAALRLDLSHKRPCDPITWFENN